MSKLQRAKKLVGKTLKVGCSDLTVLEVGIYTNPTLPKSYPGKREFFGVAGMCRGTPVVCSLSSRGNGMLMIRTDLLKEGQEFRVKKLS